MRLVYRIYAYVFLVSGLVSVVVAHREMAGWLGASGVTPELLVQYRFLRAIEAGFGALLLTLEDDFFAGGRVRRVVLASFLAIPVARTVSLLVDGAPSTEFVGLLVTEYGLFLGFLATGPRRRGDG